VIKFRTVVIGDNFFNVILKVIKTFMKYEQLKNFILNEMKMLQGKNYHPVMIRYLNQNSGKATKKNIQEALHDTNPEYLVKYFQNSPVFNVLKSRQVVDYDSKNDTYYLLDHNTFTPAQKAHITMYCDGKIRESVNPINPRIILFSVTGQKSFEHFKETITTDVVTNTLSVNTILKNFQVVRVCGSIYNSQNFSKWKELKKGDILLFYHNEKYVTSAILEGTEQNQELADHLWGYKDEESKQTWELILYISPSFVFDEDVNYQKLNKLLGYEEEFKPTRILDFTTVNKNKTDKLIEKFASLENALKTIGFTFNRNLSIDVSEADAFLSEKDFEKLVECIPLVVEYNKAQLTNSDHRIPNPEDIQLCAKLQYYCALRISELLKLTPNKINLNQNEINIDENTDNVSDIATIYPSIKNDLGRYLKDKYQNETLFPFTRQLLWSYYKKAGNLAKLNLFKEQNERTIEDMFTTILKESRGIHMLKKGASEGLVRLKLRLKNKDEIFKSIQPTIQELKDWEYAEYETNLKTISNNKPITKDNQLIEIIGEDENHDTIKNEKQDTFEDEKLSLLTPAEIKAGYTKISDELLIPEEKITEIITALASGRHVLLAGPIGTGKTRLAKMIPEIFWNKVGGYYSEDHTATSDWSTQDVIGGIFPKMEDGKPVYDIQNGCVVDTVRKNWENDVNGGMRVYAKNPPKNPPYKGTWLIIDEFNRADIDKAFGQLFTALRTRWLKIPTDKKGVSYKNLKIPEDYRIIGTLNTADKHFLFQLSDALKSRFAYIEIDIPKKEQQENEIYYAIKNALDELGFDGFHKIVLDYTNKRIDKEKSETDFYNRVMQAYDFLDTVRVFKKLGTAILKLIYQNLIVGTMMTKNSKMSLDNALTSNLIPQLENLSVTFVAAIYSMHSNTLISYLKEAYKNPNRQSYVESFEKILDYLQIPNKTKLLSDFANGHIKNENEEAWILIQTAYDNKKKDFEIELNQIKKSMDDLIKSMVI